MAWVDLDVSVWNLAGAAAIGTAFACGPSVPFSGDTDGSDSSSSASSASDDAPTSVTTPTSMGPGPTSSPTTTPPPECYSDQDCAPGYYCYNGYCQYYCCNDDIWYYDCYSHADCGSGQFCEFNYCYTATEIEDCGEASLEAEIPAFDTGQVQGLTFTDFDADGLSDLAIAHADGIEIAFAVGGELALTVPGNPGQIFSGDVDGDADEDLIVALDIDGNWGLGVVENNSAAGYPATTPIQSAIAGEEFAAADFNGNGGLDVFVRYGSTFELYEGLGDGSFIIVGQDDGTLDSIAALSHNGDAPADLLRVINGFVELALGDDPFSLAFNGVGEGHGAPGRRVVAADTGGDGVPEIFALSTIGGSTLVAQWSDLNLVMGPYRSFGADTQSVTVADLEDDGTQALFIGTQGGVEMLRGSSPTLDCRISVFTGHAGAFIASRTDPAGRTSIGVSDGTAVTILREP